MRDLARGVGGATRVTRDDAAAPAAVAIEVKTSATVQDDDLSAIRSLADALGPRLVSGVVLYTEMQVVRLGERLTAVPIPMLWRNDSAWIARSCATGAS